MLFGAIMFEFWNMDCPDYEPSEGNPLRCSWYDRSGACRRADRFMCMFWEKARRPMPDQHKTLNLVDPFADPEEDKSPEPTIDPFADGDADDAAPPARQATAGRLLGSLTSEQTPKGSQGAESGPVGGPPPEHVPGRGGRAGLLVAPTEDLRAVPESRAREIAAEDAARRQKMEAQVPQGKSLWDSHEHERPAGGEDAWIPPEHLSGFAERGISVELEVPRVVNGEKVTTSLWVVPEVDEEAERMELSWQDLGSIANCLIAFPGAKVTELRLSRNDGKKRT